MADYSDFKNLGRQGPAARTPGMWPNGEGARIRDAYDGMLQAGTKTKICYACKGATKINGKTCSACSGTGSVPSA